MYDSSSLAIARLSLTTAKNVGSAPPRHRLSRLICPLFHCHVLQRVQGRISIPYRSAYGASKHAVQAYFDCLRAEVADLGVVVLVVSPGYVKTNISHNALTGSGGKYGRSDATIEDGMPVEKAAHRILAAVQSGSQEFVLASFMPKLAIAIRYAFPALYFWVMERRARKEKAKDE